MILYLIILTYYSCRMSRKLKSEGTHLNFFLGGNTMQFYSLYVILNKITQSELALFDCGFKNAEKRWKAPIFVKHL